jgi:uncharacterized protein (DUF427 family)
MKRAIWNGAVLAESDQTIVVEGNHYFPPDAVNWQYLEESQHRTTCFWKGTAGYYDVAVEGKTLNNAAWFYPEPSHAASHIKDHVAFWKGVRVQ